MHGRDAVLLAIFIVLSTVVNGALTILRDGRPIAGLAFFMPHIPPAIVKVKEDLTIVEGR